MTSIFPEPKRIFSTYPDNPCTRVFSITDMPRIAREKKTITAMMGIYCRQHHGTPLCMDCEKLLEYALRRLDACPFADSKPACNKCQVHCYAKQKRQQIQAVMRFAGPRMLTRHPWLAILHLLDLLRKNTSTDLLKGTLKR